MTVLKEARSIPSIHGPWYSPTREVVERHYREGRLVRLFLFQNDRLVAAVVLE